MPVGTELHNIATGMRLRIEQAPRNAAVDPMVLMAVYPPNSPEPPDHVHPYQSERFEILEGAMTVRVDGHTRSYVAGDTFEVPVGTRHAMWNNGAEPARVRWRTEPALRTWALFAKLSELAQTGRTNAHGTPGVLQSVVLAAAYRTELRLTRPPPWVQRVAIAVLAPIGRMLGYRG